MEGRNKPQNAYSMQPSIFVLVAVSSEKIGQKDSRPLESCSRDLPLFCSGVFLHLVLASY